MQLEMQRFETALADLAFAGQPAFAEQCINTDAFGDTLNAIFAVLLAIGFRDVGERLTVAAGLVIQGNGFGCGNRHRLAQRQ